MRKKRRGEAKGENGWEGEGKRVWWSVESVESVGGVVAVGVVKLEAVSGIVLLFPLLLRDISS